MGNKLGAIPDECGVFYRVWAPEIKSVHVEVEGRIIELSKGADGYHSIHDQLGQAGDQYAYRLDGRGPFPDPVSRHQTQSVHGSSTVIDSQYRWKDTDWRRPPFRDLSIYELHVGTFTEEGTFRSAIDRLKNLRELGVTAIELMPLADFPGDRGWGYDGVLIYAPARCYGTPEDLRALVDAAHQHGLAVILDVVYNHFGPDGNYLAEFSPHYFSDKHHTPWGKALNFDGESAQPVREFFLNNIRYWMEEFHFDGFRLDAVHEIHDDSKPHLLAEISQLVHSLGGCVVAEDFRNESSLVTSIENGGFGLNAVWADDFHHTARVSQTRETASYYNDFTGSIAEVVDALEHGWIYRGQFSKFLNQLRGTQGKHLPPERFIHCISNHDQTGNRARGERVSHLIPPASYRALSALICLSPYTPMLFMGQEWATSSPFLFFTDHEVELGRRITEGRRKEFSGFPEFSDPQALESIPDPQARETLEKSRLRWDECLEPAHANTLLLYQTCLSLRQKLETLRPSSREGWQVQNLNGVGAIRFTKDSVCHLLVFSLGEAQRFHLPDEGAWRLLLSSEEKRFGGSQSEESASTVYQFAGPEVLLFESRL